MFGKLVQHLVCNICQYQDPARSPEEWRKQVVLSKYDICSDDPLNTSSPPAYSMAFGIQSIITLAKTMNAYVKSLHRSIEGYNDGGFELALPPKKLAAAMEKVFHQHGLLTNQCIPLQLSEIEKNKALKNPLRNGVPLPAPTARGDLVWTKLCTFHHPQNKEQCIDEMYGRLVRTHKWGHQNTRPVEWWGIECTIHRWSTSQGDLFQPSQNLSFTPNEPLSFLTYITTPFSYTGGSNCLKEEWSSLLHEIANSLRASSDTTNNETITKRTHLSEEDDCTSFTHTLPLEYDDVPELIIKDFGESIPTTPPHQKNRKSEGGIGNPPNAPVRKNKSTSRVSKGRAATAARAVKLPPKLVHIGNDDYYEDSQDPDAIVPSATPSKKRKRQTSATPPSTQPTSKRGRGISPPPATLSMDINDGLYNNTTTTPPLSDIDDDNDDDNNDNNDDNDSCTIIEDPTGTDGIREHGQDEEGDDFEDDERIEPSQQVPQQDQIIT